MPRSRKNKFRNDPHKQNGLGINAEWFEANQKRQRARKKIAKASKRRNRK